MTRLTKGEALEHWRNLPVQPVAQPVPIPYKHAGSTYGADGIRIEGTREFIDSVLAQLKPILECENASTRIGLNYQEVEARPGVADSHKAFAFAGNWVCYIKVHARGDEAQAVNAFVSAAAGKEIIASRGY